MTYESTPQSLNRSIAALESEARSLLEKANQLAIQRDALLEGQWGKGATEPVREMNAEEKAELQANAVNQIEVRSTASTIDGVEVPAGTYIKNMRINNGEGDGLGEPLKGWRRQQGRYGASTPIPTIKHGAPARVTMAPELSGYAGDIGSLESPSQSEPSENHDPAISTGWANLMKGLHRAP